MRPITLETSLFDVGPPPTPPARINGAAYCLSPAADQPEKIALTVAWRAPGGPAPWRFETWTYAALAETVGRVAAGLQARGLRRGDRVLLRMGPTPRFPLIFFGAMAAGGAPTPTSAQLTTAEARFVLRDSGARIACVDDALAFAPGAPAGETPLILGDAEIDALMTHPEQAPYADTAAEDPAFLVYTSGATGRPKGVLHAHRAIYARRMMWDGWYGMSSGDRILHAGALNWTYTLGAGLMDPLACGASAVVAAETPDPSEWPMLASETGASLFAAVPSLYRRILKYGDGGRGGWRGLRHGLTAGEKLPEPVRAAWREATGLELYEALGMSECSTFISAAPSAPAPPGRAGRPQIGRRVAVLPLEADGPHAATPTAIGAPGVLAVHRRDPGLMLGYWNRPEADAAAWRGDWFATGDLVSFDPDGSVIYHGRADDQMNAMGYRVAPQEVEDALSAHPGVAECAVAEISPKPGVSVIAGFVVRTTGADVAPEELIAHCAERLAPYKSPREIVFLDALPRTATGKLRRRSLSELAGAAAATD